VLGENHPDYAQSLNNLATLRQALGEYTEAEPLFQQAIAITKRGVGVNHLHYAISLHNLAALYEALGEYAKEEPLYRSALEITKHLLGENHPEYAGRLNNLAAMYKNRGEHAKAMPMYRQALEIRRHSLGENHPDYALSLNNLARLYQAKGDFAKAEPMLRQATEILKQSVGESHPYYANSLNNLAGLYEDMGDYDKALPQFRRAMEIQKRAVGENHPDYARNIENLGMLYEAKGDHEKAEPLFGQAMDIRKRTLGEKHPYYAHSMDNLAMLHLAKGDYSKAEPLLLHSLEIIKLSVSQDQLEYATILEHLANLYWSMQDQAKAEPLFVRALEITRCALGEQHPECATRLITTAMVYQANGQLVTAEQFIREGLTIHTRWTQEVLATLGERQRLQLLGTHRGALDVYLSVAPAAGIKAEDLYRHVLAWKGVVAAFQDSDRLARDLPDLKQTLERLAHARADLARIAFMMTAPGQRQAWRLEFDALRERKETFESDLARKSAASRRDQERRLLGAAAVAEILPPGTVLVDFFDYFHNSPPEGRKGPFRRERRLLAFVLRRARSPVVLPVGASGPVGKAARAWREALVAGDPEMMHEAALELKRRVWEPLQSHLEAATTVVVSPDGALSYFPLAALPGRRSGAYLLEDLAIGYVSSGRRLVETLAAPTVDKAKRPVANDAGLLAVGGIDYQADPGGAVPTESVQSPGVLVAESQRVGFTALAGTGPEARRIGQLFDAAFLQQHALVLTGAEPTEAAVKQQLGRRRRYLHLATHGFFESPARVAALRAGLKSDGYGIAGAGSSEEAASLSLAPLLHSGVALAGAARMTEDASSGPPGSLPDHEDGILTAEEVLSLDLRGTDLVVLSACETGLGQGYYGQGVMGLQRAFHAAGSRADLASLWKVDDDATTVLMEQFYTNMWSKKMPKLEALRQAQLTVLNDPGLVRARRAELAKRRGIDEKPEKLPEGGRMAPPGDRATRSNPALWASFVLSGDVR
jgi:CHAT domain-containing protein/tetratricopeptide (TPR) repeat protein